jgi:hypothetical protein
LESPVAKAATDISLTGFTVNWRRVAKASSYIIKIFSNGGPTPLFVLSASAGDSSLAVTGLTQGTEYDYQVFAHYAAANADSGPSNTVAAITTSPPDVAYWWVHDYASADPNSFVSFPLFSSAYAVYGSGDVDHPGNYVFGTEQALVNYLSPREDGLPWARVVLYVNGLGDLEGWLGSDSGGYWVTEPTLAQVEADLLASPTAPPGLNFS